MTGPKHDCILAGHDFTDWKWRGGYSYSSVTGTDGHSHSRECTRCGEFEYEKDVPDKWGCDRCHESVPRNSIGMIGDEFRRTG